VLANDPGLGDTPVTIAVAMLPAQGTTAINNDHTITYTPSNGFTGEGSFTYTVTDADGEAATATVTLLVSPV
jgi:hypothetical protein